MLNQPQGEKKFEIYNWPFKIKIQRTHEKNKCGTKWFLEHSRWFFVQSSCEMTNHIQNDDSYR